MSKKTTVVHPDGTTTTIKTDSDGCCSWVLFAIAIGFVAESIQNIGWVAVPIVFSIGVVIIAVIISQKWA